MDKQSFFRLRWYFPIVNFYLNGTKGGSSRQSNYLDNGKSPEIFIPYFDS